MTHPSRFVRSFSALLAAALLAAPVSSAAQEPVRSFDQLNIRLKPGDIIRITTAGGTRDYWTRPRYRSSQRRTSCTI